MYMSDIIRKSQTLNGLTRVRTLSGDILEGKFTEDSNDSDILIFELKSGGVSYMPYKSIESITLLDNLQIVEEASARDTL